MDKTRANLFLTPKHFQDLEDKGYTVVSNVLTEEECDKTIGQYREWLSQFGQDDWPMSRHSLIQGYNTGHMEPTWFVRLKAKHVFQEVWKTDKLLSSFDAIAIGRPPEDGDESFQSPGRHWLHVDQSARRLGLHAYQGAVYLEESCEDDWTMHVIERSHLYFNDMFKENLKARVQSVLNNFYILKPNDVERFEAKGCVTKRVPVPKGGMVLWDSRLVHANARPLEGRKNPGRWRFCVFVSMTPAIWASQEDLDTKREAYSGPWMTSHWSSQEVYALSSIRMPCNHEYISVPRKLPDIAKTDEAKLLAGVIQYDFQDGTPTGIESKPIWDLPYRNKPKLEKTIDIAVGGLAIGVIMYMAFTAIRSC